MDTLKLGDNIAKWRQDKDLTQEMLADYMGVTKSSVSKWERGVTLPDVALLPLLASYFDVSIDQLMGYEPQLSKEQIQKYYFDFALAFARDPFEQVIETCQKTVKQYYASYALLLQMSILWLNHLNLAPNQEGLQKMIGQIYEWCERIESAHVDPMLIENAKVVKAMAQLMNQEFDQVIEGFEDHLDVNIIENKDSLLTMAYLAKGQTQKADLTTQVAIYRGLTQLIGNTLLLFNNPSLTAEKIGESIKRIDGVINLYDLIHLNPNLLAQYQFQVALYEATQKSSDASKVLVRVSAYIEAVNQLLKDGLGAHGDTYFTAIDDWLEDLSLGTRAVRNQNLVIDSVIEGLKHPAFEAYQTNSVIQKAIKEWEELKC